MTQTFYWNRSTSFLIQNIFYKKQQQQINAKQMLCHEFNAKNINLLKAFQTNTHYNYIHFLMST